MKIKCLTQTGLGKHNNAVSLTEKKEVSLWKKGALSENSPKSIMLFSNNICLAGVLTLFRLILYYLPK